MIKSIRFNTTKEKNLVEVNNDGEIRKFPNTHSVSITPTEIVITNPDTRWALREGVHLHTIGYGVKVFLDMVV